MKKFKSYFLIALIGIAFSSCSDTEKNNSSKGLLVEKKLSNEGSFESEILAIDEEIATSGELLSSMRYTKENGAVILVHAHLSKQGKIIKIDEEYNEGDDGNYGMNSFYLKNDKVFASRAYFENKAKKPESEFVERISYYSDDEKVVKTLERKAAYEEDIGSLAFKPGILKELKIDRAKRALNQEGEFSTNFQGFVLVQVLRYIVVGGSEEGGYTSAVRVDQEDDFVRFLVQNESECMNKRLQLSFQNITDDTGFEYQSYVQGSFKK